jgi:hypothetical protein
MSWFDEVKFSDVRDARGEPLQVEMQRQPVLTRKRLPPPPGKARGKFQDTRTAAPTMVRVVRVVDWSERSRVVVMYGMAPVRFSISTGRAIGMRDWILSAESHAQLKALRRERFPVERKTKPPVLVEGAPPAAAAEADPAEEDIEELPPETAAPPEPELVGRKATKTTEAPKSAAKVLVRVWSEKGVLTVDDALPESDVAPTQLSAAAAHQCVYEKLGRVVESMSLLERRAFVDQDRTLWTLFSVHERDTSELDSAGRGRWMQWQELLQLVPWYDEFGIDHATVEPEE